MATRVPFDLDKVKVHLGSFGKDVRGAQRIKNADRGGAVAGGRHIVIAAHGIDADAGLPESLELLGHEGELDRGAAISRSNRSPQWR